MDKTMETGITNAEVEQLLNEKMGVEDDIDGVDDISNEGENTQEQPFDAESIRIDQQHLSLKYVYELYQDGVLKLDPDFQRRYVWGDRRKKSLLIESMMLRIPIPAFYFFEKNDGKFLVIDGQQRLHTIFDYLEGNFGLKGLEYLSEICDKKKFQNLDAKYQQRIRRTQLAINILDERSPRAVVFDIFRRVNTGGVPLNPHEMRNAICSESTRELLKNGAHCEAFLKATRSKIKDLRLDDQEVFLRFITLYRRYDYKTRELEKLKPSKLIQLMDNEITELDKLSKQERTELVKAFELSMERCWKLFGENAFVKLSLNQNRYYKNNDIINKSLFAAFSVLLADPDICDDDFSEKQEKVCMTLAKHLENLSYMNSVTKATGDERNILVCFEKSLEVLQECGIINR